MPEETRKRSPRINYIKRSEYWRGKMYEKGRQQAQLEAHEKKPLGESAKEHIGEILNNIQIDPIEAAAVASLAYLMEPLVEKYVPVIEADIQVLAFWVQQIFGVNLAQDTIKESDNPNPKYTTSTYTTYTVTYTIERALPGSGIPGVVSIDETGYTSEDAALNEQKRLKELPGTLSVTINPVTQTSQDINPAWTAWFTDHPLGSLKPVDMVLGNNKTAMYLLSFVIAFCIIRWGDKMINAGVGGLKGILGLFGFGLGA